MGIISNGVTQEKKLFISISKFISKDQSYYKNGALDFDKLCLYTSINSVLPKYFPVTGLALPNL